MKSEFHSDKQKKVPFWDARGHLHAKSFSIRENESKAEEQFANTSQEALVWVGGRWRLSCRPIF